jgi:hypothetical protein
MRDRGHAAVEFALAVGVLLLPVALAVLSFGPWLEHRVVARAAAAEAARAAVVELDHVTGASVASSVITGHGLDLGSARLGWCGSSPTAIATPAGSCPLTRGSVAEATVQLWVPLISTPWGSVGGLWATASHGEPVDLYRSLP